MTEATPTEQQKMKTTHKEINDNGINGSGHKVWQVITIVTSTGQYHHIETFDTKAEATTWIKWA